MGRFLIWVGLALVGWLWWQSRRRTELAKRQPPPEAPTAPAPQAPEPPQAMWVCARCGVHFPQAEAVMDAHGRPCCSAAHAQPDQAGA